MQRLKVNHVSKSGHWKQLCQDKCEISERLYYIALSLVLSAQGLGLYLQKTPFWALKRAHNWIWLVGTRFLFRTSLRRISFYTHSLNRNIRYSRFVYQDIRTHSIRVMTVALKQSGRVYISTNKLLINNSSMSITDIWKLAVPILWQHHRLSLWQPVMPSVTTKLASWRLSVFSD